VLTGGLGYGLLFGIVFAETGLLTGFFYPADSFLFTIGVVVGAAGLDLRIVLPLSWPRPSPATPPGIGWAAAPAPYLQPSQLPLFRREHLIRSKHFYDRYGGKTIVYAKFVPIVRTFAPFLAGVAEMNYGRFLAFSVGGVVLLGVLDHHARPHAGRGSLRSPELRQGDPADVFVSLIPVLSSSCARAAPRSQTGRSSAPAPDAGRSDTPPRI